MLLNNAADGLQVDDGVVPQLAQRLERAAQSIDSGAAHDHLDRWIAATQG